MIILVIIIIVIIIITIIVTIIVITIVLLLLLSWLPTLKPNPPQAPCKTWPGRQELLHRAGHVWLGGLQRLWGLWWPGEKEPEKGGILGDQYDMKREREIYIYTYI